MMRRCVWLILLSVLACCGGSASAVDVVAGPAGVNVTAKTYAARLDAQGNFRSLRVGDVEFLSAAKGASFPGKTAGTLNVTGKAVIAEAGGVRVEYDFDDAGFSAITEGGSVEWWLSTSILACAQAKGQSVPPTTAMGDVRKVIASGAAIGLSEPFHIMHGKLIPSRLTRGGKPEERFSFRIDCGASFEPEELLSIVSLQQDGLKDNQTPIFSAGQRATARLRVKNLGRAPIKTQVRFRLFDQLYATEFIAERPAPLAVEGGQIAEVPWETGLEKPGLYWLNAGIVRDGSAFKGTRLGMLHEPEKYRPALTRPADFAEFWARQLNRMRAIPFDEKLTESAQHSTDQFIHYDLEIAGPDGKRIRTFLRVPRQPGVYDAEVFSHWGSDTPEKILAALDKHQKQPEGVGMWQRGGLRIRVGAPQPADSTYTRWVSRDDNNMLDSYLLNVRMADYLRSRKDVKRLWLFGASRSGASILAAAALSPERVAAVNVHVPTSCGLSWTNPAYKSWGSVPAVKAGGLQAAAYFDPVNFAPDLAIPLLLDGGLYDNLSPPAGILAFHNWADKAPFKRYALDLGGHGFFTAGNHQRMEKELAEFLAGSRE